MKKPLRWTCVMAAVSAIGLLTSTPVEAYDLTSKKVTKSSRPVSPAVDSGVALNRRSGNAPKGEHIEKRRIVTGSLIPATYHRRGAQLDSTLPVSVYTKDRINKSGEQDVGKALRKLDPSLTLSGLH